MHSLSFIFSNHFILDRVEVDPGKAGREAGILYVLDETPVHSTCNYT